MVPRLPAGYRAERGAEEAIQVIIRSRGSTWTASGGRPLLDPLLTVYVATASLLADSFRAAMRRDSESDRLESIVIREACPGGRCPC